MARRKTEPATNGAGDGILARVPSAEELHAKAQELRDELARVEALLECVERMRGGPAAARLRHLGQEECLPVDNDEPESDLAFEKRTIDI